MKYKALSLLLTVSILAMSMATLFTACPEPEPTKSATAPGQARDLSADTSKALEITFGATAPIDKGTNKGGAVVDATKLKYRLYYAKVDVTSNSVTVSDTTTATDVITAVGSTTGTDDKAKGRIDASPANLATGFRLSSLTPKDTYRYTVVVIHPDGTTNSTPAPAQTSGEVRAKPSQATVVDSVEKPTVTASVKDSFTVTWNDPDLTTAKDDDGEQLDAGDVGYVVYYTSATTKPTPEAVKAAGSSETKTSGKVPVGKGATKTASVPDKAFVHTVYMVLEAINTTDESKTKLSEVTEYAVTGASTPSDAVTAPTVTPGKGKLTVQVTPLTTDNFGTTDNGTPLDADTVTYIFYYAKKGEQFDVGGTPTKVEDAGVTSAELYAALKALDGSTNTAKKGKVALTTGADNRLGSAKEVPSLTPGTDYYYFVRVEETATPDNGTNTAKTKTATLSAAKATGNPPKPTFSTIVGANTHTKFTISIGAASMGTAKKADGEAVNPDGSDVAYKLYYASSTDALTTAAQVKEAALAASKKTDDKTGGVKDATAGSPVSVTDRAFTVTVYAVVEAIIKTDTSKTALSDIASYKITGAAAAPTGTIPVITARAHGSHTGAVGIGLRSLTGGGSPQARYGTKPNGKAVEAADVKHWLYYSKTPTSNTVDTIVSEVEAAEAAVIIAPLVGDILNVTDKTKGIIKLIRNNPDPSREYYSFYYFWNLTPGASYRFFMRAVHPHGVGLDSTKGKSGTLGYDSDIKTATARP